jgi:hypothetical protein
LPLQLASDFKKPQLLLLVQASLLLLVLPPLLAAPLQTAVATEPHSLTYCVPSTARPAAAVVAAAAAAAAAAPSLHDCCRVEPHVTSARANCHAMALYGSVCLTPCVSTKACNQAVKGRCRMKRVVLFRSKASFTMPWNISIGK